MMKNEYFEKLLETGSEFAKKQQAHKEKKQGIIDQFGWDSEELKAWYEEEEALKWPYSAGVSKAVRAWLYGEHRDGYIQMDDFLWENEVHDFIETLRKAGIRGFIFTNSSTALMENIHWFADEECILCGTYVLEKKENRFGRDRVEQIKGLAFEV